MILGIDISHWDEVVDFNLLRAMGVEFVIVKASQGTQADDRFAAHVAEASAAGMIVGSYHWSDPMVDDRLQAAYFVERLQDTPVKFAMVDVEQHWQDWGEWARKAITQIIPPERIEENAKNVLEWVENHYPTILYSRVSFLKEFAPGVLSWCRQWPTNWAQYPYRAGRVELGWEELLASNLPNPPAPRLPVGSFDWQFWQFSGDKFLLPGITNQDGSRKAVDLDVFNGNREELLRWCGEEETVPDPIVVKEEFKMRVGVPLLNIRTGPGVNYQDIGDLTGNQVVSVQSIGGADAWVEIEPGKWSCVQRGGTQYMTRVKE